MPPKGYSSITVPDEVLEQVTEVMMKYECESTADAVGVIGVTSEHSFGYDLRDKSPDSVRFISD